MKSNDLGYLGGEKRMEARQKMVDALKANDTEKYAQAFDEMIACIGDEIRESYEQKLQDLENANDRQVLAARGVRQLTSEERKYYQKLGECLNSADPKQALANANIVMPTTVFDAVFDELQTSHPLFAHIQFLNVRGQYQMLLNKNGQQMAVWGPLCGTITQEIMAGFGEINGVLNKLSAFLPVCKATLEMGPEWLDDFVRQTLYEALANGLEVGIVAGTGNNMPIGMNRDVSEGVSVSGGVYPLKSQMVLADLSPKTVGNLLSLIAVDPNGKPRALRDVLFIVNAQDYYQKVMPDTTVMGGDGTYRNNVMPYPMTVVPSIALDRGNAIMGIGYKYFMGVGMNREGRIEYSDEAQFLEDVRVYLIKLYGNGRPIDNNAFLYLDISDLQPTALQVTTLTPPTPSNVATLANLKLGALAFNTPFVPGTTTYTASTSNATNTIMAIPSEAGATMEITNTHDSDEVDTYDNGEAITWANGTNTVKIVVTAANGTSTQTYTVTVTATLGS